MPYELTLLRHNRGSSFKLFFAGLFLAATIGGVYLLGWIITEHEQCRRWVETSARINSLRLDSHVSRSRGRRRVSYRTVCSYDYTFEGQNYSASRVSIIDLFTNSGRQQRAYRILKDTSARLGTVPCFVNPRNPREAVLFPGMPYEMLLIGTFVVGVVGAISLASCVSVVSGSSIYAKQKELLRTHPDQPWMHDPRWAEGVIPAAAGQRAAGILVPAVFAQLISLPLLVYLPDAWKDGGLSPWLGLLFPLVCGLALAAGIYYFLLARKFGRSRLELTTVPAVPGGFLEGTLVVAGRIETLNQISVTLRCMRRVTTGSGKRRHTREECVCEQTLNHELDTTFGQNEARLPVRFQIAESSPTYDDSQPRDEIYWKLSVRSEVPGVNFSSSFDVPVFRAQRA